nr:unnamed protein product [Callosobruchus chinensis]
MERFAYRDILQSAMLQHAEPDMLQEFIFHETFVLSGSEVTLERQYPGVFNTRHLMRNKEAIGPDYKNILIRQRRIAEDNVHFYESSLVPKFVQKYEIGKTQRNICTYFRYYIAVHFYYYVAIKGLEGDKGDLCQELHMRKNHGLFKFSGFFSPAGRHQGHVSTKYKAITHEYVLTGDGRGRPLGKRKELPANRCCGASEKLSPFPLGINSFAQVEIDSQIQRTEIGDIATVIPPIYAVIFSTCFYEMEHTFTSNRRVPLPQIARDLIGIMLRLGDITAPSKVVKNKDAQNTKMFLRSNRAVADKECAWFFWCLHFSSEEGRKKRKAGNDLSSSSSEESDQELGSDPDIDNI